METENIELASMLNVPIITTGTFYGHKGPGVHIDETGFQRLLRGSNRFQPLLKEAMQTGVMPGNPDFFERLQKPMPAPITLNHEVLEDDKIKDSLKDVEVEFAVDTIKSEEFPDGKPWIVEKFSGVQPLAADIIRRFFKKRSAEIMELTDPETGERLPAIISTAFLDKATRPAVPGQTEDVLVEFSGLDESHYVIYPNSPNNPTTQGVNIMDGKPQKVENPVDVAELQKKIEATLTERYDNQIAELQSKVDTSEQEKDKLAELAKKQHDEDRVKIAELQEHQNATDTTNALSELMKMRKVDGRVLVASPAFEEIVTPHIKAGGIVELAEGQNPRQAFCGFCEGVIELAMKGKLIADITPAQGDTQFKSRDTEPKNEVEEMNTMVSELMTKEPSLSKEEAEKKAFVAMLNRQYGGKK